MKKESALKRKVHITSELEHVVGKGSWDRTEISKKIWAYIKSHNRQDPSNKRMIIPDEKLAAVFGKNKPVDMFEMNKLLSKHIKSS